MLLVCIRSMGPTLIRLWLCLETSTIGSPSFCLAKRGWSAPEEVLDGVRDLGFNPVRSELEAEVFGERFDALSLGSGHASWPLT